MSKTKISKTSDKIKQLEQQLAEKENQYLRALADYQNLEKRISEKNEQAINLAVKTILLGFLTIKDDLDQAADFEKSEGLKLIKHKFGQLFTQLGVKELKALNQPFSPATMECIQTKPGKKENLVIEVNQKGYLYDGQLLRPARVAVSKLKVSDHSELN